MIETLRRRRTQSEVTSAVLAALPPKGGLMPYHTPPSNGRCYLSELPAEVLTRIFLKLDRASLTRCFRLCKELNEFLVSNTSISLSHTLQCNSLNLNPYALNPSTTNPALTPPSQAELLATLRERLTRFRNFIPKRRTDVQFNEDEGSLYEYLEGVLMRGIKPLRTAPWTYVSREIAFYDLRRLGEWEDEPGDLGDEGEGSGGGGDGSGSASGEEGEEIEEEEIGKDIRQAKKFDFNVSEFAVDPGQDLLVLVEVQRNTSPPAGARPTYRMKIHLKSLKTFEPHPRAKETTIIWPTPLFEPKIELAFQICDDGLFILKHHMLGSQLPDILYGWQWTTGRLGVQLMASNATTFQSFVLLSPSAFVIPCVTARIDPDSETQDQLENPDDLTWTHTLNLYAFPPFSPTSTESEPIQPPHTATHVTTVDLPTFHVDIRNLIPPPRMTVRTDPPPRHDFPTHPVDFAAPFTPTPESGLIILDFYCQLGHTTPHPHYSMCMQKSTLAQYLPAPTSSLLRQAFPRPAPVVPWQTLAPYVRMFGPDLFPTSWVCYVYHNRYATIRVDLMREEQYIRLYDFDPLRVRKEICDRRYNNPPVGKPIPLPFDNKTGNAPAQPTTASSSSPDSPTKGLFGRKFSFGKTKPPKETTLDGDRDGIVLVTEETVIPRNALLPKGLVTGSKLPYLYVEERTGGDNALIDGERIVIVHEEMADDEEDDEMPGETSTRLEILEF